MKFSMANFSPKHQAASKLGIATWTCKFLFLVIGIVSTSTVIARFAFPYFLSLLRSSLPRLRIPIVPFLAPPYLFVAINFIIVAIWKLNGIQLPDDDGSSTPSSSSSSSSSRDCYSTKSTYAPVPRVGNPPDSNPISKTQDTIAPHSEGGGVDRTLWPPPPPETEPREEEEEYPDGIDATWKAIIESKSSPTKNACKKSGIWEKTGQEQTPITPAVAFDGRRFKKSETFREAATAAAAEKREMRKSKTFRDVWVEGDEVFRCKVEEFIKMNYEQMRLQGKESEQPRPRFAMVNVS